MGSANGIFVAGTVWGDLDGNSGAGGDDAFLVKYDADGTKIWTRLIGSNVGDIGIGVAVGGAGDAYLVGGTNGDLDGNANAEDMDIFVAKFDADGNEQWIRQLGTKSFDMAVEAATDSAGNVYVSGFTRGDLDGNANSGSDDAFLVKYDADGNKQWTRLLGSPLADQAGEVAVDSADDVYVTGYTQDDLHGKVNSGSDEVFLAKYDADGNKQWTQLLGELGDEPQDRGLAIALDSADNPYVAGVNGYVPEGQSQADGFLVRVCEP